MPTGYTAAIKQGISFEEYALSCARNFGALVMMRDDPAGAPIPEFKPSDFHKKALAKAKIDLALLKKMSSKDAKEMCEQEFNDACATRTLRLSERAELKCKYEEMLRQVQKWTPPTEEHQGMKAFMQSQIEESIQWDCGVDYLVMPVKQQPAKWLNDKIVKAIHDIEYSQDHHRDEVEKTDRNNKWVEDLRKSLEI